MQNNSENQQVNNQQGSQNSNAFEMNDYQSFCELYKTLCEISTLFDSKWSPQEKESFERYVTDVKSYMESYVFVNGCLGMTYSQFQVEIKQYGSKTNILGEILFQKQLQYYNVVIVNKMSWKSYQKELKKKEKKSVQEVKTEKLKPKKKQKVDEKIQQREGDYDKSAEQLRQNWPADYDFPQGFDKPNCNIVFVGHVDAGKSTLLGTLLIELNQIDKKQIIKADKQAKSKNMAGWSKAYLLDEDENQQNRGKTIQCSKVSLTLQNRRLTVFDAPGHQSYVPNMIMGVCQSDIGLLLISARNNQFEAGFIRNGQTKEHAILLKSLGINKIVVAVSKMETVHWSEQRFNEINNEVSKFLEKQCGFASPHFIPIDSIANKNILTRSNEIQWYSGPCLVQILDNLEIQKFQSDAPLRMIIVNIYKEMGETYLFGKIISGKISQDNQILSVLPANKRIKIKRIMNSKDQRLPFAFAGENIVLKIKCLDDFQIMRGDMICSLRNFCPISSQFIAQFTCCQLPDTRKLLAEGYRSIFHMNSIIKEVEITKITNKETKKNYMTVGQTCKVQIALKHSICLDKYEITPQLGQFILRDDNKTIGFGKIMKYKPQEPGQTQAHSKKVQNL